MKNIAFGVLLIIHSTVFAQFSPEKKYNPSYLTYDSTTKAFKKDYLVKAPDGAPNIVIIMLDDVGFSTASTFGGIAQTPFFDTLASKGLKYNNFHTTAICAPSRAALLTGRNHHSVHMGHFTETAFDAPGYDGYMPFEKATMAEVLKENGYNTFAVGKWHLTPVGDRTAAGPFNRWPTGRGFEDFYGFLESATDQYYPVLWNGHTRAEIDTSKGEHFNTIITNKAIELISDQKKAAPTKPFFLLYAPGAVHSPMQVDQKWIDMYKGKFDMGYDKYREIVLENQKRLGVVPKNVSLHPRHPSVRAWDSLPWMAKNVFARAMEAHAGFLTETDYEIGRLIRFIDEIKQMENTIVVLIIGDNGATKYTAPVPGVPDNKTTLPFEEQIKIAYANIDKIGVKDFKGDIPLGWTQATNTPFRLFKSDANGEGGTHNPMILVAPKYIKEAGQIRTQYTHLIDVWPTLAELIHTKLPSTVNGYKQAPLEGTSFAYSLNQANAKDKHTLQYYESGAHRALYYDGWKATCFHIYGTPYSTDKWELFDMKNDFNERVNLAKKYPEKLKQLINMFEVEAKKYKVYPLQESWFPSDEYLRISDSRYPKSKQ
jgi:arylsulfatase